MFMVYNKFKRGFSKNILAYIALVVFSTLSVLLVILDDSVPSLVIAVLGFLVILLAFIYDMFFCGVFVFDDSYVHTNKYPRGNSKYAPKMFRKASIQLHTIIKVEKRTLGRKQFLLTLCFADDEPLQYVFEHEDTRDYIYNKLVELTKSKN